jgi:hypothetical protein
VLSKTEPFAAPPASGKSWKKFTVDVYDEQGTKIQGLAWDAADTERLYPALDVGGQYLISYFDIKPVTFFRDNTTGHKFFLNFTSATQVQPYAGAAAGWKGPLEKVDLSMRIGDMPEAVKDFSAKQSIPVDLVRGGTCVSRARIGCVASLLALTHLPLPPRKLCCLAARADLDTLGWRVGVCQASDSLRTLGYQLSGGGYGGKRKRNGAAVVNKARSAQ